MKKVDLRSKRAAELIGECCEFLASLSKEDRQEHFKEMSHDECSEKSKKQYKEWKEKQ